MEAGFFWFVLYNEINDALSCFESVHEEAIEAKDSNMATSDVVHRFCFMLSSCLLQTKKRAVRILLDSSA